MGTQATASCLITMQQITPPITVTQSDFHDLVGATCGQLSRNYSPYTYRRPSSAAQPLAATVTDWLTHTGLERNLHKCAVHRHLHLCMYMHVKCLRCSYMRECCQILHKCPLHPKNKPIRIWWSDVKRQGRCDILNKSWVITQEFIR